MDPQLLQMIIFLQLPKLLIVNSHFTRYISSSKLIKRWKEQQNTSLLLLVWNLQKRSIIRKRNKCKFKTRLFIAKCSWSRWSVYAYNSSSKDCILVGDCPQCSRPGLCLLEFKEECAMITCSSGSALRKKSWNYLKVFKRIKSYLNGMKQ